jgi:hypothetical protein
MNVVLHPLLNYLFRVLYVNEYQSRAAPPHSSHGQYPRSAYTLLRSPTVCVTDNLRARPTHSYTARLLCMSIQKEPVPTRLHLRLWLALSST